jgi:DNA primase
MNNTLKQVAAFCQKLLYNLPAAKDTLDYLNGRNLSDASKEIFQFGYFPSNENLHLLIDEIGEEKLSSVGLIYDIVDGDTKERHASLENYNFLIPYKDVYGSVVGFAARSLLNDEERKIAKISKYKNTGLPKGKHLFGLYETKENIIKNNIVYLVEGQIDLIKLYEKKFPAAALGSSGMTFEQFALLNRYVGGKDGKIILLLDNDAAGINGAERIVRMFGMYANIRVGRLPEEFKDVDQYLAVHTGKELERMLKEV